MCIQKIGMAAQLTDPLYLWTIRHEVRTIAEIVPQSEGMSQFMCGHSEINIATHDRSSSIFAQSRTFTHLCIYSVSDDEVNVRIAIKYVSNLGATQSTPSNRNSDDLDIVRPCGAPSVRLGRRFRHGRFYCHTPCAAICSAKKVCTCSILSFIN